MPSSFSTDLKLELMVTGENAGTWGTKTNTNLNLLQQAIAGYQEVNIAGGAQTTTLAMSDGAISNARNAVIKLTGTITGNQVVTVPNSIEKTWIVYNGTVGAFTVQFKTASGTGPTFSTTNKGVLYVYSDGTNVVDINALLKTISLFTLPATDGTNGQAITTNGSGALSFTTITTTLTYSKATFTGDGTDTTFTIDAGRAVDNILVFVNGICLVPTDDYTISGTTLTFQTAPVNGGEITVRYLPI
jgi:hypothetical protein